MKIDSNIVEELQQISPFMATIPKGNVWSVPNGYFDTIVHNILKLIKNDPQVELQNLSPLISSLPKENVFTVPDNYFNKQPFIAKIFRNEAKIISISSKRKWKKTWLAAASIVLLIGISIPWWKANNNFYNSTKIVDEKSLTEEVNKIDDSSLINYINANTQTTDQLMVNSAASVPDINEAVNDINDNEISQYVAENQYLALK